MFFPNNFMKLALFYFAKGRVYFKEVKQIV